MTLEKNALVLSVFIFNTDLPALYPQSRAIRYAPETPNRGFFYSKMLFCLCCGEFCAAHLLIVNCAARTHRASAEGKIAIFEIASRITNGSHIEIKPLIQLVINFFNADAVGCRKGLYADARIGAERLTCFNQGEITFAAT